MKTVGFLQGKDAFFRKSKIGEAEIAMASQILRDYKKGKASLELRIVEDEQ